MPPHPPLAPRTSWRPRSEKRVPFLAVARPATAHQTNCVYAAAVATSPTVPSSTSASTGPSTRASASRSTRRAPTRHKHICARVRVVVPLFSRLCASRQCDLWIWCNRRSTRASAMHGLCFFQWTFSHTPMSRTPGNAEKDIPVTWDDQKHINRFGLLNARLQDLLDELKDAEVRFGLHSVHASCLLHLALHCNSLSLSLLSLFSLSLSLSARVWFFQHDFYSVCPHFFSLSFPSPD